MQVYFSSHTILFSCVVSTSTCSSGLSFLCILPLFAFWHRLAAQLQMLALCHLLSFAVVCVAPLSFTVSSLMLVFYWPLKVILSVIFLLFAIIIASFLGM